MDTITVSWSSAVVALVFVYCTVNIFYNLFFHPLSRVPGPRLWAATRLRFVQSLVTGNLTRDIRKLHEKYGPVVRTAPDEVSFASEEAVRDIFNGRTGAKQFPRDTVFWKAPPGQADNLIHANDYADSSRMRQVAMPAFTERALTSQEPRIKSYVDLTMHKLSELVAETSRKGSNSSGAVIDAVRWMNWFGFDLVGELSLGESFGCLQDVQNHPWVDMIFDYLKVMTLSIATRYYRGVEDLLLLLVPPSLKKQQADHNQHALDKLHRRVAAKKDKVGEDGFVDFIDPMIDQNNNPGFKRMSMAEVESTMSNILIAGSETTGSTLSGLLNLLSQNPTELRKLETEIRGTFDKEEDITLRALQNLPFLNAALNESMRVANPVPGGLLRVAPMGGATVCGIYLPEKTHVHVDFISMALSEKYFHRPNEFLPDRWLPEHLRPSEFVKDHLNSQKPFGLGSRSCIGKAFAMAEMRMLVARLVWKFDISEGPGKKVSWNDLKTFVVAERIPMRIKIKERVF